MRCAACNKENREDRKFCTGCGVSLAMACPACGAPSEPGENFCGECGAPVAGQAPPRRPAEPAGTRKVVTIVFADLVGSTALHERLDPESARRFMESYYAAARGAVESHGGTVTQLLGDGVKAVFGIPRVAEDDALQAVRAAVAMQESFRALAEQQRSAVGATGLRVAVNSGEVVANEDSEIIGDPVNVAARLQEQGRDGDVVVGEATQRLVSSQVTLELLGSFALKGRAEAVKAYRVASLDAPSGATTAEFVGRDEELARIGAVYREAVAMPATRLAVLLGSPGLGKSRLIGEFARRSGEVATVVDAHCSAASGATFAPLVSALRELLGIEAGASEEAVREAIEGALPEGDAERARVARGIAALLAGSPAAPEETFFVVRRLLAGLAARRPVVLVIDDLQWAEPLLLDLVEHLVLWGTGVPLLVLVGARPELRDVRSSLVVPGGLIADVVTLSGLPAGAAMRLAANVIGAADLPAAVAAKVLSTSEGNPLFISELVRMLVDEGVLTCEGDRWTIGVGLETLEMPPTIHALLAARIERLAPEDCAILERASVVGRHFSRSAVAELLPGDVNGADLDARLEALQRSELIERDTGWLLGEPVLRFHHVLIRDAAYRRILKGTRAELHARFADWVEARVGDSVEHDERIGWHLEQAHQHLRELGPIDTAGRRLGNRASKCLAAAGRRALARDDVPHAASLLGRALDVLDPGDAARADLALDWCEALLAAGDVGPAAAALDELERFTADDPRRRAWHTCFAAQLRVLTAPEALQAAADEVAEAAEQLTELGDAVGEAKAHSVHAQALARLGKVGACEAALDLALAAARRAGDRRRANAVLAGAPPAALWGPSPVTRASGRCLDVVRVLRITQGAPAVEAVALSCQGVLEALRGRTDAARRMVASSRKMVEELGIVQRLFEADFFAGRIEAMEGNATEAERLLRTAYEGLRDVGLGIDAARAGALLGRTLLMQDRAADAEVLSHESERLAGDDLQAAIAWRGVRAEALARRGEHAAAIELAQAAVAIASNTDALLDHADARMALAAARRAAGRGSEADAEERRAIELWEAKGATLLAERARRPGGRATADTHPAETTGAQPPSLDRRIGSNAGYAVQRRFDAALAARDFTALLDLFSETYEETDHPTGSTYGREAAVASLQRFLRSRDASYCVEPLATLGDFLVLTRRTTRASATESSRFDVGEYENEAICVLEVDDRGLFWRQEVFAPDHLGDAISRLYERYAEQLSEGAARERAGTIARAVAAMVSQSTDAPLEDFTVPDLHAVDHRMVGVGPVEGSVYVARWRYSWDEFADEQTFRIDDVLALGPDALLRRTTVSGTLRESGGAFDTSLYILSVFGPDGRQTRVEAFDIGKEAEALGRFDELTAGPQPARPPARRVRPNAATRHAERYHAAFLARDVDALMATVSDHVVIINHPTGTEHGAAEAAESFRWAFTELHTTWEMEALATLGDVLALHRMSFRSVGTADEKTGIASGDRFRVAEVDERGLVQRAEHFADDRLGHAIARLYERHAELLPQGPARDKALAIARNAHGFSDAFTDFETLLDGIASLLSPSIEIADHRLVGFGRARGVETALAAIRAMRELAANLRFRFDDLLALSDDVLVLRMTNLGTARDGGGAFEREICGLYRFGPDGLFTNWEVFEADRAADALARFDELSGRSEAPATSVRRVRANRAAAVCDRLVAALDARDIAAVDAAFSDTLVFVHRETAPTFGKPGAMATWRGGIQAERLVHRIDPLATLGESLALVRQRVSISGLKARGMADFGLAEMDHLIAVEEADGQFQHLEQFALDQLGDAIDCLYRRYAGSLPDGPVRARAEAIACTVTATRDAYDLDHRSGVLAADIEIVDHRTLGTWGGRGAEAMRRHMEAARAVAENIVFRDEAILALEPEAMLVRRTHSGTERVGGGAYERPFLALMVFDDAGRVARWEWFDVGQEVQALARFDELVGKPVAADARGPDRPASRFSNAATRLNEHFVRAWAARDWDAIEAHNPTTASLDDRRPLMRTQGAVTDYRMLRDVPNSAWSVTPIATRGERLALSHAIFTGDVDTEGGELRIDYLCVDELGADGRLAATAMFDPADEDAARAELDRRYAAGEGGAGRHGEAIFELLQALADRDWDAMIARSTETMVEFDHRALAIVGTSRGAENWVKNLRALVELAPDSVYRANHFRQNARGSFVHGGWRGSHDGGPYEIPLHVVMEFDDRSLIVRMDLYDDDGVDAALARLAELAAPAVSSEPFANAATRLIEGPIAASKNDLTAYARCLATELRYSDRRRQFKIDLDRDGYLQWWRELRDVRELTIDNLATRGERLTLGRAHLEVVRGDIGPSDFEHLVLLETDQRGETLLADVRFDLDDVDAAYAELDARYEVGEGGRLATWWRHDFRARFESRDWDGLAHLLAPTFVGHDHRLVGWGTRHGPSALLDPLRAMAELAPDARSRTHHLRIANRALISDTMWMGTRDGGTFESPYIVVVEFDADGRAQQFDFYDPPHLEQARARFAEIAERAPTASSPPPHRFANTATRTVARAMAAISARDWDGFGALFTPGFRNFDRRALIRLESGRDEWLESHREMIEMTTASAEYEVLATRGDRLALVRNHWRGADGDVGPSEIEWLLVIEVDERGDHIAVVTLDPDDLDAAYDELDDRMRAQAGAEAGGLNESNWWEAYRQRDWEALAALCSPDIEFRDHRLAGFGTLRGVSAVLDTQRTMVALAPDVQGRVYHQIRSGRGLLAEMAWLGTRDGGAFESPMLGVFEFDEHDRLRCVDAYDPQHFERARARFDELAGAPAALTDRPRTLATWSAASAGLAGWVEAYEAGVATDNWEPMRRLCAPGLVFEDRQRRALVSGDVEVMIASARERGVAGAHAHKFVQVGAGGERVGVWRVLWSGGPPDGRFEIEYFAVIEVDEAGLVTAILLMDLDDPRAALREMWVRWTKIDPTIAPPVELIAKANDAFEARDRARMRALYADDLVVEDHRLAGMGRIEGADAYLDSVEVLWDLAPAAKAEHGWFWPAIRPDGAITVLRRFGELPDGGPFESEYLHFFLLVDGRVSRVEMFEVGALDAARARFEELGEATATRGT